MKTTVISYSLTGNNEALATSIASGLAADHIKITEPKIRTILTTIFDLLLGRTPEINYYRDLHKTELVIFIAPVWFGNIATPLRACFKDLKSQVEKYAFITIRGGGEGSDPELEEELEKRMGKEPYAVVDLRIANLLPLNPKPSRKLLSSYRLHYEDVKILTYEAIRSLRLNREAILV